MVALLVLGGCAGAAPPDPAATEAAVSRAVAATATALAPLSPASPTLAPARTATAPPPTATLAPRPSPTPIAATAVGSPTTGTPAAPAGTMPAAGGTPGVRLTVDEAAYIRSVSQVIREFNRSFDRFVELVNDPRPEDASWRLSLSAELALWASGSDMSRNVRSPQSLAPVHGRVIAGLDLYQEAARQIVEALDRADQEQLTQGLGSARQARQSFNEAEMELQRLARERGL
jgi:hypothetical protein